MKVQFVLACAAAGIAASAFGGTAAHAETTFSGSISFDYNVVKPGDSFDIYATCDDPAFTTAPVNSSILEAPDLRVIGDGTGGKALYSYAKVKKDAAPGSWPVSFTCGGVTVSRNLRVAEKPRPEEPYSAIGIQDREIKPGQEVLIVASCRIPHFRSSKVVSPVLTSPDLRRADGGPIDEVMSVLGRINKSARPGTYPISFTCGEKKVTGEFTVVGKPAPAAQRAQVPVKPKGAADTGDIVADTGDSTQITGQPADDASGTTALVIGAAGLLLASTGAGAWFYRRLRRA